MGFRAFCGRVLFSSLFLFAAIQQVQEFGADGGTAALKLKEKLGVFGDHFKASFKYDLPKFNSKYLVILSIGLQGLGALLFILGSSLGILGAYMLLIYLALITPIVHDLYNFEPSSPEFTAEFDQFLQKLSLFGALLFFLGTRSSRQRRKKQAASKSKIS